MQIRSVIRGPILSPRADGGIDFFADGALAADESNRVAFCGDWRTLERQLDSTRPNVRVTKHLVLPPFLDAHIHIPQHPIRGQFMDGCPPRPAEGRLLWALEHNVFPTESRCGEQPHAREVVKHFLSDTLLKGVVGGAAYMTVHTSAARIALDMLPDTWSVGLVLMNMNCPAYLRTKEATLDRDVAELAQDFGRRLIVTDRFAVAVDSPLRKRAVALARKYGLRMQTHLNEQIAEKALVEKTLYPDAGTYTDVYQCDGLLDCEPILAHCVRMSEVEFDIVARHGGSIAHCPVSNTLLGSGVMPIDRVLERQIPLALCTDVGASPTTSLLTEMVQFLRVHAGRSAAATPELALQLTTRMPAKMLKLDRVVGSFDVGMPMSFIEIEPRDIRGPSPADVIVDALLNARTTLATYAGESDERAATDALQKTGLDESDALQRLERDVRETARGLESRVQRVTVNGATVFDRTASKT